MNKRNVLYSKVWEYLRREMNNPSLMPVRSQRVSDLLGNGRRSLIKVITDLNAYCIENGIMSDFSFNDNLTIGELLDQAKPLNVDRILSRRLKTINKANYVY